MKTREDMREEMIDKLVEHKVTNIKLVNIANLFRYGMKGYDEMSDEELKDEYELYFEEAVA